MPRLAFATYAGHPGLTPDDARVEPHLPAGVALHAVPWDGRDIDWGSFDMVVLRTTWDYHLRPAEFRRWLDRLDAAGVEVSNPTPVLRWNLEKTYLRELAAEGVETVPTVWLRRGARVELAALAAGRGWGRVVVKPTVGATSHGLFVARDPAAASGQERLDALLDRGAALAQPLLIEVERDGEWSLVFFDGEYSHAAIKRPRAGDVRVQTDFGGSVEAATPPAELRRWAAECVRRVARRLGPGGDSPLLYARVDAVVTAGGPRLMELELIEPQLFLDLAAGAARRFAGALARRLGGG